MCLSKMLLKEFKNILSLLIAFSFFFSSTLALSANPSWQKHVNQMNKNQSVWTYADSMKGIFKTQEDGKQIDKMASELEGPTKKWLWRLEVQGPDSFAFRVNGQIQAVIKDYNPEENSFVLNGKKVTIKNGESFLSYKTNFMNAFNTKVASFDSLFFNEAHAAFFLPFLALFAIGAAAAHASTLPPDPNAIFKAGARCNSNDMPSTHSRRVREVRKNFRPNMKFNGRINTQHRFETSCKNQYETSIGEEAAVARCKCIYRKQLDCSSGGYNMTLYGATNLCIEAQTGQGPAQPYTPAQNYPDPVTPCYNDKGQVVNCTAQPPAPAPAPEYPTYQQDPVTPCYNDKGQVVSCPTTYPQPTPPTYPDSGGSGNAERRD